MRIADIEFINCENAEKTGVGTTLVTNDTLVFFNLHNIKDNELEEILNYKSFTYRSWKEGKKTIYFIFKYGYSTDSKVIYCSAGFSSILIRLLQNKYNYTINGKELYRAKEITRLPNMKFSLWDFQHDAIQEWINNGCYGIIQAPTASGKSVIGCSIIKKMNLRTIILCHTADLLINVWFNYLVQQFGEEIKDRIGIIGGGLSNKDRKMLRIIDNDFSANIKKDIVIATSQSLLAGNKLPQLGQEHFGLMITDECHHYSAEQFKKVSSAIRAAYRLGLSVTGDTYIPIIKIKQNLFANSLGNLNLIRWMEDEVYERLYEIIRIDELYNKYNKNNEEIIDISKHNIKTFSFDGKKTSESKITNVHRYKCAKKIYKIEMESGREIKVTEDHSLFKLDNDYSIKNIKTTDLKIDDYLIIPKRIVIQSDNETDSLNVLKQLGSYKYINQSTDSGYSSIYVGGLSIEFFNNIRTYDITEHMINKNKLFRSQNNKGQEAHKYRYEFKHDILPRWKENKVIPVEIFYDLQLSNPKLKSDEFMYIGDFDGSIRINHNITKDKYSDLMYILGFFSGDGWISRNDNYIRSIGFSGGYHESIINKLISKINNITNNDEKVKIFKREDSNNKELHIHSICIAKLFESLGVYTNDIDDEELVKCVPSIIFGSSIESKKKFIEGLIDADGHLGKKNLIYISNTSKKLIYGIMTLINSIGYVCNISKREPSVGGTIDGRTIIGKRESYLLYFDNRLCENIYDEMSINKELIDKENNTISNKITNVRREEQKITMLPSMNLLKELIPKVGRMSTVNYDMWFQTSRQSLIKRERFSYNDLDIILTRLVSSALMKNDMRDYILRLYNSDVCFDRIKNIEVIDEKIQYVYDISVDVNTQNFVGNNIFCHNSATIFRPDGLSPIFYALLGDVRYRIGIKELAKKGLLVEPIFYAIIIEDKEACNKIRNCTYKLLEYSRYVKKVSGSSELKFRYILGLCQSLKDKGRKFMLYTDFVNKSGIDEDGTFDAESVFTRDDYVKGLLELKIKTIGVSSEMSGMQRQDIFNKIGKNELDGIVFGSLGSEGINIPSIEAIILANATASTIRFPQRTGRAMRLYKGKINCYVYEILLNTQKELKWSEDNFLEYEEQGFKKEKIYVNNDGYLIKKN